MTDNLLETMKSNMTKGICLAGIFSCVTSQEVIFLLSHYIFPHRCVWSCSRPLILNQLYNCSILPHSAAARFTPNRAEEPNTFSPSLYTVWHSLEPLPSLFPPLHSVCLGVVQTSIGHNWTKLPISVSCL